MEELKRLWYWLVARGLVQRNAVLEREVRDLKARNITLSNEADIRVRASADAQVTAAIVREKMGIDTKLPGKIAMLREQLQTELAYVAYLEENLREGTLPFNKLPLEKRKEYFQRIKDMV